MKIIILGAGEVGVHIASSLRNEGHDLVLIEKDPRKVARLASTMDILAVAGDGCNPRILKAQGVATADLFFAVTNNDPVNLLSTLTARRLGAKQCVVRVGDPALGKNPLVKGDEYIKLLNPERLVAEEIFSLTRVPGANKARFFHDGRLALVQARPSTSASIYGRPLKTLQGPPNWILTGIHRTSGTVIPRGDTVLQPGDLVYGVGPTETIQQFFDSIGVVSSPTRNVLIAGAGRVGTLLAQLLVRDKIKVTVVNRTKERAFRCADRVPEALVLQGDVSDPTILREAGVEQVDYFVATTSNDEVNLLSSLLARELGAHSTVALYHQPEFLNLMQATRIDIPVSPRLMIAGEITRMVHRREIVSIDIVEGGEAEIVDFKVPANARALKKPIKHMNFPRKAIIGTVIRGEEIFVPGGDFQFQEGDEALVFTLAEALPDLEKLFRGH